MAPKQATPVAPPLDFPTAVLKLSSEEATDILPAVTFLSNLPTDTFLELEEEQLNEFVAQLCQVLGSADPEVRTIAHKLGTKLVIHRGKLQVALLSDDIIQANWRTVNHFGAKFEEYKLALAEQAAATEAAAVEAATKKGGKGAPPAPAVDPELLLPVPSKYALDAALRFLSTAAVAKSSTVDVITATAPMGKLMAPLALLLEHHTLRVPLRAVSLFRVLMLTPRLLKAALQAGAVPALIKLLKGSNSGAIKLAIVRALITMCSQPGAQHVQLLKEDVVEVLMQLIMDPETGKCPIPMPTSEQVEEVAEDAEASAATVPPPVPEERVLIDYTKPELCTAEEMRMDAARALLSLCNLSSAASSHLARMGGLNVMLSMLPMPKKPPSSSAVPEGAEPPPVPGPRAGPLDTSEDGMSVFGQVAAEDDWDACLFTSLYQTPTFKATTPETQSMFLKIVASLLALPGLQEAVWHVKDKVSINEVLLHFFADEPPPPEKPPTPPPPMTDKRGKPTKAPAKQLKSMEPPEPVKVQGPLDPPFPLPVKAAALEALVNIANHANLAASMAADLEVRKLWKASATTDPTLAVALASLVHHMLPRLEEEPPPPPPPPPVNPLLRPPEPEEPKPPGPLHRGDAVRVLKDLAQIVEKERNNVQKTVLSRAVLMLRDEEVVAKARPPLGSPPPTPPPPPLATSLFVWDALGRPQMADGNAKLIPVPAAAASAPVSAT